MAELLRPFSAEFQNDPYPTYHRLRTQDPVHCANLLGFRFWVLTRYCDVVAALRDPRLSSQTASSGLMPPALTDGNIFFQDPPEHTRLRTVLNKAFCHKSIEALRPRIATLIERTIDRALLIERKRGYFDVVHDLGMPVSLGAISGIMGLPQEDGERLKCWTEALAVLLDATQILTGLKAAHRAAEEITQYFGKAVEQRVTDGSALESPPRDFLCALIAARDTEARLTNQELLATSIFTLMAGHETVTSAVASGLLALLEHPTEFRRLRENPELAESAFEEMLRFDPPGQLTTKTATQDLEIAGHHIRKGQAVVAVLAAANRDPAQFPDPDRFDIGRTDNRHLSFSHGPHYCVGAALARLQGQLLLSAIVRRLPDLSIEPQRAVRKPGIVLRGLRTLPARGLPHERHLVAVGQSQGATLSE